jgi:hypothetical protein
MEIFLKVTNVKDTSQEVKIRASGPESEMGELIFWFERVTGLTVQIPETSWRLDRGGRPTPGQGALFEAPPIQMRQLSSHDATVAVDG